MSFGGVFSGKKVLITGHTGFKGSWLTSWLRRLGADVVGYSNGVPTHPSLFEALKLENEIHHVVGDVRDLGSLRDLLQSGQPDFVFHLAAQSLVFESYRNPLLTVQTNSLGTVHLLEALRSLKHPCVAVLITSDKCYENDERASGYSEADVLGGKDPYSASKAAAEILIRAYRESFFPATGTVRLATARAGNAIGGGDWSPHRIVPDCVRAWSKDEPVRIRNPGSTRPWQHVLEPLSGYLSLASELAKDSRLHGESFNFGPGLQEIKTVETLIRDLSAHWGIPEASAITIDPDRNLPHESGLLSLSCEKAQRLLQWKCTLELSESVRFTAEWYRGFYQEHFDARSATDAQMEQYETLAKKRKIRWAR